MKKQIVAIGGGLLCIAGVGAAGWLLGRGTGAPVSSELAPETVSGRVASAPARDPMNQLAEDLESKETAARARGEARLGATGLRQREDLRQLAKRVSDAEVAARIGKRVAELDAQAALDPPPISLEVKDATLGEVAFSLGKAAGAHIAYQATGDAGDQFTLSVKDQPFWQVVNALNHQHSVHMGADSNGWALRAGSDLPKPAEFAESHGFVAYATAIRRTMPSFSTIKLGPDELMLGYDIVADPRLHISAVSISSHKVSVEGEALPVVREASPQPAVLLRSNIWSPGVVVRTSAASTGKNATIRASARFTVVVEEAATEVNDPEKHAGETITVGTRQLKLTSFKVSADRIDYGISKSQDFLAMMNVYDANGEPVASAALAGAGIGGSHRGTFTPPLRVRFSVPTKSQDVTVAIELKDIALP